MNTTMNEAVQKQRTFDRRLFAIAAVLFPLIILFGFGRTYYLRGFFAVPPVGVWLVHLHAILMTAWVLLFIVQVRLISSRRVRVHQRLGFIAIGLAVLIVITGFFTAVRAAKFGPSAFPAPLPRLPFLVVPMTDLLMFTILFSAAIYYREKPAEHKRFMLLTAINFLPPALARIPIERLRAFGPLWFFGLPTAIALVVLFVDRKRNGKFNRAMVAGTFLMITSFVARLAIMGTETWLSIAKWLTSWAA
jgi:hypothetical protein